MSAHSRNEELKKIFMDLVDTKLGSSGPSCADSLTLLFHAHSERQGAIFYEGPSLYQTSVFKHVYTPRLRGKAGADSTSLPLSLDKMNHSADNHSQFGPGDVNLCTGLSEEVNLDFLELARNNYGMLMSGVSALTAEMCMRAA